MQLIVPVLHRVVVTKEMPLLALICSFLNNQHILEECLLSDIEKHAGTLHKVLAI